MSSIWNAKGDTASTMILWLGSLIAAIICVAWLAQNLTPDHITLQQVDNELTDLQRALNTACRMDTYWKNYYPKVNEGNLIINDLQVCIDASPCSIVFFESNGTEPYFEGTDIVLYNATDCGNIETCDNMYYSGDNAPEFGAGYVLLKNATTCENKNPPVRRCRLLMCSLNMTVYLKLTDMIYTNVTKDKNDIFTFEAH